MKNWDLFYLVHSFCSIAWGSAHVESKCMYLSGGLLCGSVHTQRGRAGIAAARIQHTIHKAQHTQSRTGQGRRPSWSQRKLANFLLSIKQRRLFIGAKKSVRPRPMVWRFFSFFFITTCLDNSANQSNVPPSAAFTQHNSREEIVR